MNANSAVGSAIYSGRLVRKPCEVCGSSQRIQAHHTDYDNPLDVRWLCRQHHLEEHSRLRNAGIAIPGDRGIVMIRMDRTLHKTIKGLAIEMDLSLNKLLIRAALEYAEVVNGRH